MRERSLPSTPSSRPSRSTPPGRVERCNPRPTGATLLPRRRWAWERLSNTISERACRTRPCSPGSVGGNWRRSLSGWRTACSRSTPTPAACAASGWRLRAKSHCLAASTRRPTTSPSRAGHNRRSISSPRCSWRRGMKWPSRTRGTPLRDGCSGASVRWCAAFRWTSRGSWSIPFRPRRAWYT